MTTLAQTVESVSDALGVDPDGEQGRAEVVARTGSIVRLLTDVSTKLGLGDDVFAEGWQPRVLAALDALVDVAGRTAARDDALAAEVAEARRQAAESDGELRRAWAERDEARSAALQASRRELARDPVALLRVLMPAGAPEGAGQDWTEYVTRTACARAALDWWEAGAARVEDAGRRGPPQAGPGAQMARQTGNGART